MRESWPKGEAVSQMHSDGVAITVKNKVIAQVSAKRVILTGG
jgi:hypothetical protein